MKISSILTKIAFISYFLLTFLLSLISTQESEKACSYKDIGKIVSSCKDLKREGIE
jgi:hypothetical protein